MASRCNKCGGVGKQRGMTGVGWNKDFWDPCSTCGGSGWVQDAPPTGKSKKKGCFVATAAFGDYNAPEVVYLSAFRDESLSHSLIGRSFIRMYYVVSPWFASMIAESNLLRSAVRTLFLRPMISFLQRIRDR